MEKQRNALRAGIFMLFSLAMVIVVIVAISGAGRFTQSFNTYPVAFSLKDDIGGLRIGDDVRIGGLRVGSVQNIRIQKQLSPDDKSGASIVVFIDVPSRYAISSDAEVFIQKGLTGAASINIDNLGSGAAMASTDYLRGLPDPLSGIIHKLGELQPDLRVVVSNLKTASGKLNTDLDKLGVTADAFTETGFAATSTVQDLHIRLPSIIDRYNALIASAVAMLDSVHQFVGPSQGDFHQTVANLNNISTGVKQRLPDILDRTHNILTRVDDAVERADDAMVDIRSTASNARLATGSLRSILTDNRAKFDTIISSLRATSENLKYASIEIRHSPWRLLYQPKPDEVANLNTYDSVRQFAEGANSLDDAASSLRDTLRDPNADPQEVKKLMAHLDDTFEKFQAVQQKLWKDIQP